MKRTACLILVACMLLSFFSGCGVAPDENSSIGTTGTTGTIGTIGTTDSSSQGTQSSETDTQDSTDANNTELETSPDSSQNTEGSEDSDSYSTEADSYENTQETFEALETETLYDGIVRVEFRNDNGSYIDSLTINAGETVPEPTEYPTGVHGRFYDWYADRAGTERFDFSKPLYEDTVIWAAWNEYGDCEIKNIELDLNAKTVSLTAHATRWCSVTVYFIDESLYFSEDFSHEMIYDCQQLYFSIDDVIVDEEYQDVTLTQSFDFELPKHFVIQTVLSGGYVDCIEYFSLEYTERYEEYQQITPEDFEGSDRVLCFGDGNNNDFGVLADEVRILSASTVEETALDDSSVVYRITNPNEAINEGDRIFLSTPDGAFLFLAEQVEVTDGIYTVTALTATEENSYALTYFYKFLKIDLTVDRTVATPEEENITPSALSSKEGEEEPSEDVLLPIDEEKGIFKITGSVKGVITAHIKIDFAPDILGGEYFRCSLDVNANLKNTVTVSAKVESDDDMSLYSDSATIDLGDVILPLGVYGLNVFAEFDVVMSYSISGSVTVENQVDCTLGFRYSTKSGFEGIKSCESSGRIVDCDGEAEVNIGIVPAIGIGFLGNVARGKLQMYLGVQVIGRATGKMFENNTWSDMTHNCYFCIDGEINANVELSIVLELNLENVIPDIFKDDEEEDFNFSYSPKDPLYKHSWHLIDFYVSIIATEEFDPMGIGECPNHGSATVYVYPYLESCYPDYDPESDEPYPGVAAGSDYMTPRTVVIMNRNKTNVYSYAFNITNFKRILAGHYTEAQIIKEIQKVYGSHCTFFDESDIVKDAYGNDVYRIEMSVAHGDYLIGAFYANSDNPDITGSFDFGDTEAWVDVKNELHTYPADDDDIVAVYPENYRKITHNIRIAVSREVTEYDGDSDVKNYTEIWDSQEFECWIRFRKLGIYGCFQDLNYIGMFAGPEIVHSNSNGIISFEISFLDLPFETPEIRLWPVGKGFGTRSIYRQLPLYNTSNSFDVVFDVSISK